MTELDPELEALLPAIAPLDLRNIDPLRRNLVLAAETAEARLGPLSEQVDVTDVTINDDPSGRQVRVRVMSPRERQGQIAGILYIHGGAFVLGDVDANARLSVRYVDAVPAVVVHVDYRLAPEHPFPAAYDDCLAALGWMRRNAVSLGIDPDRTGVVGSSAGGGLAAAVGLADRGSEHVPLRCLALMYPVLDDRLTTPSSTGSPQAPLWTSTDMKLMWDMYLGELPAGSADVPSTAAPARETNLSGLPPTLVVACDLDPLRDEDIEFAGRLAASGVTTELKLYEKTFHGFDHLDSVISVRSRSDQIEFLRRHLRRHLPG